MDKSMAIMEVLVGGLRWLKPIAMGWTSGRRAVEVEWRGRKPCWESARGREAVR